MKNLNYLTGKLGEELAAQELVKNGYQIQEKNFRTRFGEIDLVCTKNQSLIFVEVKLKIGEDFGSPEEMVNKHKLFQIQNMAQIYLQKNPFITKSYPRHQIDAVCIVLNSDHSIKRISHWENLTDEMG